MSISEMYISVSTEFEILHSFPEAATDPALASVAYLSNLHRHLLKIKISIQVFHDNRDIEFIMFKNWIKSLYSEGTLMMNHKSCEMISNQLAEKIEQKYPGRKLIIETFEDGENGSIIYYSPNLFT